MSLRSVVLATSALCAISWAGAASAQSTTDDTVEEIVVVGSQIEGSKVTAALPVTVVDQAQLDNVAATSGDDLFRSIPQMGDVSFNSSYLPNSSNSARGDVGSVNLRNLGVGNTLVLLNGRRVVAHPTSRADENLVPVLTYNTNAIPVSGIKRLEVLRDGAAALYGSDAVAGVVNTVLRDDYDGLTVDAQYGSAEGTNLREGEFSIQAGRNFNEGRGNVTLFANYTNRSALKAWDQDFTSSLNKTPLFAGTDYAGNVTLDDRVTATPWGSLTSLPSFGTIRQNGVALTTSGGLFHIQPTTNGACATALPNGLCLATGAAATGATGADRNLRFDSAGTFNPSVMPELERVNLFLTGKYDLTDDLRAFGEIGYYTATTHAVQTSTTNLSGLPIAIAATNYYNPFGAAVLNGQANPNRLPGLNIPAAGLAVTMNAYNFTDVGPTRVDVENQQWRLLGGLKGEKFGFKWESALLYSKAQVEDTSDGISATLLQRQMALSTPDAYNPFNGGTLSNPSIGDGAPSSQAAIDAIRVKTVRKNTSSLALADFKVSKVDLFSVPGGDVGFAAGVEYRRETQKDDRDARLDGTIKFTNSSTGVTYENDLIGSSASPDTKGARNVTSAYIEFAIPVVSPDMEIPFVYNFEAQLAGRYESFSDVGDVAKPKVALAWDVIDGLRFRGSWAQGFKAPNLEQVNATLVTRSNNRRDWYRCEADRRAGRIASLQACAQPSTLERRSGNAELKPEESETWGMGVVYEPRFIPDDFGRFTFTVDYWRVKQEGIVGLYGGANAITTDYLARLNGSSFGNVVRAAPTADDIAAFQGTGLAPVGQILYITDQYQNLLPQEARGLDIGVIWNLRGTQYGDFSVNFNAAHLMKFYRSPSPAVAELIAAQAAGKIDPSIFIGGGGDLIRQGGRPEWKWSASATWSYDQWTVGAFTQYIGDVEDTQLLDAQGDAWVVDSQMTANLYGQYEFTEGLAANTRLRVGVRNLTDEKPPLASDGYLGELYQPYSRYWYVSVRKSF
ncbi:MAG: TonB-dependent receptor [Pseudomonadota bacterium]|uniref:TonB-dependent receptor plug domain-containing protein n=1 Tax=unclassified Phenylobacterium TaxID=2640670 RepID=UPI0006F7FEA3|nr:MULTISPECIES: TonB-dependent receptor [unclassified Phenylobacterium]KRB52239.1 TonB-dependent receptor [Phenylobacterium sp. Root700]